PLLQFGVRDASLRCPHEPHSTSSCEGRTVAERLVFSNEIANQLGKVRRNFRAIFGARGRICRMSLKLSSVVILLALVAAPVSAEVVRIEVQTRGDLVDGQPFGNAGAYEKIVGKIYFAVDPSLPANKIVADIDKAPRNAAGKVEFSADFFLLKPK